MRYCVNCKQWFDTNRSDLLWIIFWVVVFFPIAIILIISNSRRIDCPVCGAITTTEIPEDEKTL